MAHGDIASSKIRREFIIDCLNQDGNVRSAALQSKLCVSAVTIRKDLELLEQSGLLVRVHGGAVISHSPHDSASANAKLNERREEKMRIAKAAATLVHSGESVILNVGSTSQYVAKELKSKSNIIILTNAMHIFNEVASCQHLSTIFLGGEYDPCSQITYSADTLEQLSKYMADILIMGVDGLDAHGGATSQSHIGFPITKQMIRSSNRRYIVADDRKLGRVALVHIGALSEFDGVITNETPQSLPYINELREAGMHVITV